MTCGCFAAAVGARSACCPNSRRAPGMLAVFIRFMSVVSWRRGGGSATNLESLVSLWSFCLVAVSSGRGGLAGRRDRANG